MIFWIGKTISCAQATRFAVISLIGTAHCADETAKNSSQFPEAPNYQIEFQVTPQGKDFPPDPPPIELSQRTPSMTEKSGGKQMSEKGASNLLTLSTLFITIALACIVFYLRRSLLSLSSRLDGLELELRGKNTAPDPEPLSKSSEHMSDSERKPAKTPQEFPVEDIPEGYRKAGDSLREIRKKMPEIFSNAMALHKTGALPLIGLNGKTKIFFLPKESEAQKWFFIGDIHGDFLALHRLLERAREANDFRVCFLGDLVDRGPHDLECFALLLKTAIESPGKLMWIAGNHDEALSFCPDSKRFASSVEPAEIVDLLNEPPRGLDRKKTEKVGRLFIDIASGLPRAALFPDGLLATHGGIPLEDRWSELKSVADLESPGALGDFTWTRATMVPHKKGWQYDPAKRKKSSAFEFGYRDLEGFCKSVEGFFPVKRIVRGHDHVENGWEVPKQYKSIPMLTLNGFGFHYLSGCYEDYTDGLVLGVYRKDQLPETDFVTYFSSEHNACLPN